jgi:YHS domain-containing protein
MTIDVVCGMEINEAESQFTAGHGRSVYYFCSEGCREEFLRHPEDYVDKDSPAVSEVDGSV